MCCCHSLSGFSVNGLSVFLPSEGKDLKIPICGIPYNRYVGEVENHWRSHSGMCLDIRKDVRKDIRKDVTALTNKHFKRSGIKFEKKGEKKDFTE